MKVFKLNIYYFSGAEWSWVDVEFIAQSMEQLKTSVLKECSDVKQTELTNERREITPEDLFEKNIKNVIEEELTFPIVNRSVDID